MKKRTHELIGYLAGLVVRTLIHTVIVVLIVKYAIAGGFFTESQIQNDHCQEVQE